MVMPETIMTSAGGLGVAELGSPPPFLVRRVYWLFDTPREVQRGNHAHKTLEQLLFPLRGSVTVTLDDGVSRCAHSLTVESAALHILPGTWRELNEFSPDALVLVLASQPYDPDDYIHDYEAFVDWRKRC